jgi:hypothetical protein
MWYWVGVEHWIHVQEVAGRLRLVESFDDTPCGRWLPSEAAGEPLDLGGWTKAEAGDAKSFALGVLWVRAAEGFLPGFVTGDIDRAREKLDFVAA